MCGICGIFAYSSAASIDRSRIDDMCRAMAHRGPDSQGLHMDGSLGLGMRRLSVIDLEGGSQPMTGETPRVYVVCNGEIYNFPELRRELAAKGHRFATRSDTEVIVHGYEEWGTAVLARLNGMFGLAIWDSTARRLVLARDPFGVKPLYYACSGGSISFASEIRSLWCAGGISRSIDLAAVEQYLRYRFVPAPLTAFAGISKLRAGEALQIDEHGIEPFHYARRGTADLGDATEAEASERLGNLIERAVERQLVADVPLGVMLSGGIDSSAIAAIAAKRAHGPLQTFTVGFTGEYQDNELMRAQAVASRLGADHHELLISASDFAGFYEQAVFSLEEPVATSSTYPYYRLCEFARRSVTVALTGQGADEPFAGYGRHLAERYGAFYRAVPASARRMISRGAELLPRNEQLKRGAAAGGVTDASLRLDATYSVTDQRLRESLYGAALRSQLAGSAVESLLAEAGEQDALNVMLYVDARFSLPDNLLLYGDKMSMATSLEARVPFLDLPLMEFAEAIPGKMKIRGLTQKYILKKALGRWVPKEVVRARKIGFNTPVDEWFRGQLSSTIRDRLLAPDSLCASLFDAPALARLLEEHRTGRHNHQRLLFSLLTLEVWNEQFVAPSDAAFRKAVLS
jgi:asparagine synthase (glutamine-hydrolysing)